MPILPKGVGRAQAALYLPFQATFSMFRLKDNFATLHAVFRSSREEKAVVSQCFDLCPLKQMIMGSKSGSHFQIQVQNALCPRGNYDLSTFILRGHLCLQREEYSLGLMAWRPGFSTSMCYGVILSSCKTLLARYFIYSRIQNMEIYRRSKVTDTALILWLKWQRAGLRSRNWFIYFTHCITQLYSIPGRSNWTLLSRKHISNGDHSVADMMMITIMSFSANCRAIKTPKMRPVIPQTRNIIRS